MAVRKFYEWHMRFWYKCTKYIPAISITFNSHRVQTASSSSSCSFWLTSRCTLSMKVAFKESGGMRKSKQTWAKTFINNVRMVLLARSEPQRNPCYIPRCWLVEKAYYESCVNGCDNPLYNLQWDLHWVISRHVQALVKQNGLASFCWSLASEVLNCSSSCVWASQICWSSRNGILPTFLSNISTALFIVIRVIVIKQQCQYWCKYWTWWWWWWWWLLLLLLLWLLLLWLPSLLLMSLRLLCVLLPSLWPNDKSLNTTPTQTSTNWSRCTIDTTQCIFYKLSFTWPKAP